MPTRYYHFVVFVVVVAVVVVVVVVSFDLKSPASSLLLVGGTFLHRHIQHSCWWGGDQSK